MPEDIRALATWITEAEWPQVACPECRVGTLAPEELHRARTTASDRVYAASNDPLELTGGFHGTLRCTFSKCHEVVVVAGDWRVDIGFSDFDEPGSEPYVDIYWLRFVQPPLELIVPPIGTPASVVSIIKSAGLVVWADPGAAANRLRLAIEEMLTVYGMRRYVNRRGRRIRLSTHERITEFKQDDSVVGEALEAVKWIGNTGSHEADMTVADVLEGAELFAYALKMFYDTSNAELEQRVKRINKNRGLPKKATKPKP